jgi:hypothetical protein
MKTMRIAALIIAVASVYAFAEDAAPNAADPTQRCFTGLARDARLEAIADKIALDYSGDSTSVLLQRYAGDDERAALRLWHGLRRQCFDAGESFRRAAFGAQARTVMQSAFMFQQVLVSRLQKGEMTYAEFNRRRAELAASYDSRI